MPSVLSTPGRSKSVAHLRAGTLVLGGLSERHAYSTFYPGILWPDAPDGLATSAAWSKVAKNALLGP